MQIIDELDAAMRKQFAEQFLKIKEEFNTGVPTVVRRRKRNIGVDGR